MTKNQKITAVSLIAVGLIVLVPLFALRGAEFGGSDDAGSQMVEQIQGESYEPWFTPVLEQVRGGEPLFLPADRYRRRGPGVWLRLSGGTEPGEKTA